ncbi:MAG TPA: LytR C-terminal domain-containing protein, partial [Mycobacteriales bacterium]|nr:LytR C-terminal domain-containing protein [Mycobacteriales bacterium]
ASWPQEALSDLARIRRDHEFLRVLAAAVAHEGIGNPITDAQIASAVAPQLQVDSGLSASALAHLILTYHSVNPDAAPQYTIPIAVTTFGSYHYRGGDYGDVVFPVEPQDQQVIDSFLGVTAATDTVTGRPLPRAAAVAVSVLNGTGVANQASDTAAALHRLGFRITGMGDTTSVSSQAAETVVYYASPAQEAAAQAVARTLTGFVVLAEDASMVGAGAQATVVTGSDFTVVAPSPAAPTVRPSSPGPLPSATPGTVAPSPPPSGFQAPSAAVQPLAAWDPRSCTSAGGAGP